VHNIIALADTFVSFSSPLEMQDGVKSMQIRLQGCDLIGDERPLARVNKLECVCVASWGNVKALGSARACSSGSIS
jgi:hypothetical protein